MKLAELVPKVNLSHSALSRLITRLEQYQGRKLIERQADDTDKRSVYIFLTKSGEELVKKMQTVISSSLQKKMSQKDIQNIKSLVE
ncbi:hypothetical protein GCM10025857_65770 [Alicyclobacillus contaminans]|nr:MarR family transcriptional regulator [Tetragenococcus osmophilus]GMA55220.1 hypothetical protein GCM10025857_65770 [Alicyclobacillus contaminans]GMA71012.1 hypothetical protein GCM10025885_00610 [Tetragenococcus osmophilus]